MEQLHDIVLPGSVSYVPQTTAWFVVGGMLVVAMTAWLLGWLRRRRRNRYRRLALEALDDILRRQAYGEIPSLVKRTALCVRPRAEVASLTGEAWLEFLDESYGGREFTEGAGRLLPALAYREVDAFDVDAVAAVLRHWIRNHDARA